MLHLILSSLCWHVAFAEKCYWKIFQKSSEWCPLEVVHSLPVATEERQVAEAVMLAPKTTIFDKLRMNKELGG